MELKKIFRKKEEVKEKSKLDEEFDLMIDSLKEVDGDSDEYGKICENARKLAEMKALIDPRTEEIKGRFDDGDKRQKLNANTVVTAVAYLAGMLLVLMFESDGGVITSRALQFIPRPKI